MSKEHEYGNASFGFALTVVLYFFLRMECLWNMRPVHLPALVYDDDIALVAEN